MLWVQLGLLGYIANLIPGLGCEGNMDAIRPGGRFKSKLVLEHTTGPYGPRCLVIIFSYLYRV